MVNWILALLTAAFTVGGCIGVAALIATHPVVSLTILWGALFVLFTAGLKGVFDQMAVNPPDAGDDHQ